MKKSRKSVQKLTVTLAVPGSTPNPVTQHDPSRNIRTLQERMRKLQRPLAAESRTLH